MRFLDGQTYGAANAADYIYPTDVRFDGIGNRLFIKARGTPAFALTTREETWLFEYDLRVRRETGRVFVCEDVMPPECEAGASVSKMALAVDQLMSA